MDIFETLRAEYLPSIEALMREVASESSPKGTTLVPMLDYHLSCGGKRLRALLPLWVARALGKNPGDLVAFGAACEMLHNATLVHDDVQDGDRTRRGQPTVWAKFSEARAIDLGDAMFYYAVLLVHRCDMPAEHRETLASRLMRDTLKVIDGQEQEMSLLENRKPSAADYVSMVEAKTSGLFALPIAGAAQACNAEPAVVDALQRAAQNMGVLFQIQDDVLDLYGNKGRERVGSDIAEGKRSAMVTHALSEANDADGTRLLAILDADRDETTDAMIAEAIALMEKYGAKQHAIETMLSRREAALSVGLEESHPALQELIAGMCERFLAPIQPLLREAS